MPNWCECDLKVSGPKDKTEEFRKAISCADDKSAFRINNIIPIPDSLRDAVAGSDERYFDCLYGSEELYDNLKKIYKIETNDRMEALKTIVGGFEVSTTKTNDELISDAIAKAEHYKKNEESFGHTTWYSWCTEKWGTKWDCNNAVIRKVKEKDGKLIIVYGFETAWSPPIAAIEEISKKFPDLTFKLRYFEAGCGFKGLLILENGLVITHIQGSYAGPRGG